MKTVIFTLDNPVEATTPRAGWAEASKVLAAHGDDSLIWPDVRNDAEWDIEDIIHPLE